MDGDWPSTLLVAFRFKAVACMNFWYDNEQKVVSDWWQLWDPVFVVIRISWWRKQDILHTEIEYWDRQVVKWVKRWLPIMLVEVWLPGHNKVCFSPLGTHWLRWFFSFKRKVQRLKLSECQQQENYFFLRILNGQIPSRPEEVFNV